MKHVALLLPLLAAPALFAQEGDKIPLKVAAKKGYTGWFLQKVKMEQSIDMGGQQMDMGNETLHAYSLTVGDVDDKGNLTVEAKVHRVKGSMSLPMMGDVEFDSAAPAKGDDDEGMGGMPSPGAIGQAMAAMAGKTFTIKVGPDGRVLEMKGVDEALDAARKKAGQMGGQMLGGSLNTGMVERMIEGAFGQLPTEPMAVGGVWERKRTETASRMNVQTSSKMSLQKADADQVEIKIEGTIAKAASDAKPEKGEKSEGGKQDEDPAAAMQREMMAKMKIENGKVAGSQTISRKDGFVVKSQTVMTMDITLPSPMGGGDMTINQKTTQNIERTTAEAAMAKPADKKDEKDAHAKKGGDEKKGESGKL